MNLEKQVREQLWRVAFYSGVTQDELGRRVGLTGSHVNRLLNGHCRLRMDVADRMAEALGVTFLVRYSFPDGSVLELPDSPDD